MPAFFFFQAEDGIRDWSVTGVQTCALPISSPWKGTGVRSRLAPISGHPRSTPASRTPLQTNQLRDPLPLVRGVAERELGRLGALGVEVQVVLPPKADGAVDLDAGRGGLPARA